MHLNFMAISFVFGRTNRGIAPTTFSVKLESRELPNASELNGKQLHFWTHKLGKCAQNFFIKLESRKLPKCV